MSKIKRIILKLLHLPEFYLILGLALVLSVLRFGSAGVENVRLMRNGSTYETNFPIAVGMNNGERFTVEMDWFPGILGATKLKIHPDDCADALFVNGQPLDVEKYPGHCDWTNGFVIPSSDLESFGFGRKALRFELHNGGGLAGMLLSVEMESPLGLILRVLSYLLVGALLVFIARRFHVSLLFAVILVAGILFRFIYVQETTYDQRGHDVGGHLAYVQIIAEQHHIPSAGECWTCYHPPLYYEISALPWNVANFVKASPQRALQWESFAFSLLSLFFGLLCLRILLRSDKMFGIAGILWSLWPSFVLTSARIGNDQLFYLAHVLCFWACVEYLRSKKGKFLIVGAFAAGISFMTKSTGIVSIALFCITALFGFFPKALHKPSRAEFVGLVIGLAFCVFCVIYLLQHEVGGNVGGLKWVDVGNNFENYFVFDLKTYLLQPYTDPFNDTMGRQYFWNYLSKTALFGEFSLLTTPIGILLAKVMSVALLVLDFFGLRGLFNWKWSKSSALFVVQGILFLMASLAFRIKYPFSCSNDFRYIIPVLLSFTPFVAWGIETENHRILRFFGYGVVAVFLIASVLLLILLP